MQFEQIKLSNIITPCFTEDLKRSGKFVTYGKSNLYPQNILNYYSKSVTHKACIDFKSMCIAGSGYTGVSDNAKTFLNTIDYETSNSTIVEKIAMDLTIFNGFALEVLFDSNQKITSIESYPFQRFRAEKPDSRGNVKNYYYNYDWKGYPRSYEVIRAFGELPENAKDEKGNKIVRSKEVLYISAPNPLSDVYPIPCYEAGLPAIETEFNLSKHHLSCTINNFLPSQMITFIGDYNVEEMDETTEAFKNSYTGEENTAKVFINYAKTVEQKPVVDNIQPANIVDVYDLTSMKAKQEIITANQITSPALLAISDGNSSIFGSSDELINQYNVFSNTVVKKYQKIIEKNMNLLLKYAGFENENFTIIPFDPLKKIDVVDTNTENTTDIVDDVEENDENQ